MVMNPQQPSQLRGGLLGLFDKATTVSEDTGLSPLQNFAAALDPVIMKDMRIGADIRQQGVQRAADMSRNKTVAMLRAQRRNDLADAVMNRTIGAKEAFSVMQSEKAADLAFKREKDLIAYRTGLGSGKSLSGDERLFQLYKNAYPDSTDAEILNKMRGENTPAAIRELQIRAEKAGLVEGTPEYQKFFETAGVFQESGARTAGKLSSKAAIEAAGAKSDVDLAVGYIEDLLDDPFLDKIIGPIEGSMPRVSGDAVRVQGKIDRLSGQAFIAARQMLKGGGQITDYESKRAEKAYSLLMNTRLNDEDYRDALIEFKDAVKAGYNRLVAQANVNSSSVTSDYQEGGQQGSQGSISPSDDPLGIRE